MKRVTKDVADYERGTKAAHCSMCRHFEKPEACALVTGKISPGGWCRFFSKPKQEADQT